MQDLFSFFFIDVLIKMFNCSVGYQILGWHSERRLHGAIHQSREIYLFDKDCDTKCRRKKDKRTWHENIAESAIKKC